MSSAETNLAIFQRLEAAFPHEGWQDQFRRTHAEDVVVNEPGRSEPTTTLEEHIVEIARMGVAFPDFGVDLPHRIAFAHGDEICAVSRIHGTMTGALELEDGTRFEPTGKSFELELCTVAVWRDSMIVEENLFYDLQSLLRQIGVG